ncbi:MAG TPA: PAS domain S-box protein, partial [Candidatus Acidoferrum sp.]
QEDADQGWVGHTRLVLEKLDSTLGALIELDAGTRVFQLTKNPADLESFRRLRSQIESDLGDLKSLTSDNARQQAAHSRLASLTGKQLAASAAKVGGSESAAFPAGDRDLMPEIRAVFTEMRVEEERLLGERLARAEKSTREMKAILAVGYAFVLLLVGLSTFSIFREIAKRTQSEHALRQSEERFRLMVANIKDYAIIVLDPSGNVTSWNGGAQRIKGYTADEVIGQPISIFYPREAISEGKPEFGLRTARERGRYEDEGWRVRKDGSQFWASVMVTPLEDDQGRVRGFVKITRDITEKREAEQQLLRRTAELEAANKELETFSYSVSHDLRAPLRGIEGFSQALQEDYARQLDDTANDYLRRIQGATHRMGELIDDLLNLSRVTRAEMYREPIDLTGLAAEIAADIASLEPARHVNLRIAAGMRAEGDVRLVRVVLQNLFGNAWKFTSKREHAEIEFGEQNSQGQHTYFVRDNGAGFDSAYAARLFGAFQRLHSSSEFPGTGIGLATVQRIVHRHGGAAWAESSVDRGATVFFTLGRGGHNKPWGKEWKTK